MFVSEEDNGLFCHNLNYCAFGGCYLKPTHIFHNMKRFVPKGLSGDGRCLGRGRNGRGQCPAGEMVGSRFRHSFTIGRESHKEFKSAEVSRRKATRGPTSEFAQPAMEEP